MGLPHELATDLIDLFPNASTRALARMLYKRYPEVYQSANSARSAVRYCRGEMGETHRRWATRKRDKQPAVGFPELPEGLKHYREWEPYVLEDKRTLVLADLHVPYHDKEAIEIALEHGDKAGVDAILLLGDVHDMFACSFWEKDPRKRNFQGELDMGRQVYEYLRSCFPNATIRVKIGNHEERYSRYMAVKAPELFGIDDFELDKIMHMPEHNIELIGGRRILKAGKLHLIHGHEFGRTVFSPVNPARGLYLRGKENCLGAHYHVTSDHTEKSMGEKVIRCWSIGCLCDLHPDYSPINKWNLGYAVVHNLGDGAFQVENFTIIDGKVR